MLNMDSYLTFLLLVAWTGVRCYWGYCFETLATEDPRRTDGEGIHPVYSNVEFCSGTHRILMGAEINCCDSTDEGRRFYVELKTSRELDYHTEEIYEREKNKLLKFWLIGQDSCTSCHALGLANGPQCSSKEHNEKKIKESFNVFHWTIP